MKRILIAVLMIASIDLVAQNSGNELFSLINEYRTDVLSLPALSYNSSLQAECDSIAKLSSNRWYQYKASTDGIILSAKEYQDILVESISDTSNLHLTKNAHSTCISFYKKGKNIYCVMLIEIKTPDSKGSL